MFSHEETKLRMARETLHRHFWQKSGLYAYRVKVGNIWEKNKHLMKPEDGYTQSTLDGLLDDVILWAIDTYGY